MVILTTRLLSEKITAEAAAVAQAAAVKEYLLGRGTMMSKLNLWGVSIMSLNKALNSVG